MKLAKLSDADKFANSDKCFGLAYPLNDSEINIAIIKVTGRYPAENYVVNEICKELCYVTSGQGKVVKNDGEMIEFATGDVFLIDRGEVYYFDADCEIATICTPAWNEEQHKEVVCN